MSPLRLFGRKRCQFIWRRRLITEALHLHVPTWRSSHLRRGHSATSVQAGVRLPGKPVLLQPLQTFQGLSLPLLQFLLFLPLPIFFLHPEAQPVHTVRSRLQARSGVTADSHHVTGGVQPAGGGVWESAELLLPAASCRCCLEQPAEAPYQSQPAGGRAEHALPPVDHRQAASCWLWISTCDTPTTLATQWTPTGINQHIYK